MWVQPLLIAVCVWVAFMILHWSVKPSSFHCDYVRYNPRDGWCYASLNVLPRKGLFLHDLETSKDVFCKSRLEFEKLEQCTVQVLGECKVLNMTHSEVGPVCMCRSKAWSGKLGSLEIHYM